MVFSSVPLFLDPPNWQQPGQNDETQIPQVLPPAPTQHGVGATSSMTERARLAKIPAPEVPLKCPRCDSTNTKFCYFNNYSLTQPRHFCKTCRRYWTRGGSLRNVPVGGGCRRNNKRKRTTSSTRRPRSPAQSEPRQAPPAEFLAAPPPPQQPFSFMASLQSLMTSQLGMGAHHHHESNLLGGFGASMYPPYHQINNNGIEGGVLETASFGKGLLGVLPPHHHQLPVKMEELVGGSRMNMMSKQFGADDVAAVSQQQQPLIWSGINNANTSTTNGGLWTDLSGICSSSTAPSHHHNNILR